MEKIFVTRGNCILEITIPFSVFGGTIIKNIYIFWQKVIMKRKRDERRQLKQQANVKGAAA